jgi:hypothetical protein
MKRPETTSTVKQTDFSHIEPGSASAGGNICPTIDPTSLIGPGSGAIFIYDVDEFEVEAPTLDISQPKPRWGDGTAWPAALGAPPREKFPELVARWRKDVRFLSDTNEISSHPAYQEIIGLGLSVLPLILAELQVNPDHWFWALKAITGVDPVSEEHLGNQELMARDWLKWAEGCKNNPPTGLHGLSRGVRF